MAKKNGIRKWGFSEERSARLDEIGMVWDVPDYLWEENYEAAVRYHRENGDLDVPAKYVDSEGICLEFGSTVCENQDGQVHVL